MPIRFHMGKALILLLTLTFLTSCVEQAVVSEVQNTVTKPTPAPLKACTVFGNEDVPKTMQEITDLINKLPKPLELDCFLASLKRPLNINATSSTLSLQPALSSKDPRIFIFNENIIFSIATAGEGAYALEFSQLKSDRRSFKGEIHFPVTENINVSAPFATLLTGNQTRCSGCHTVEQAEYLLGGVQIYSSIAIKPTENRNVTISELKNEQYLCEFNNDSSYRCRLYNGLLNHGEVNPQDFPEDMPTLIEAIQLGL